MSGEEAREIVDDMGNDRAIHLRGHGNVIADSSLIESTLASIRLEYNSKLLYRMADIGTPWFLPEEILNELDFTYESYSGVEKSLSYYLAFIDR